MESPPDSGSQASAPTTTFVQADASAFRDIVQRLTGPPPAPPPTTSTPQISPRLTGVRKPAFKLHERRQLPKSKFLILNPNGVLRTAELGLVLSPSSSPVISPSTGLARLAICEVNEEEKEKAIKERRFHPRAPARAAEPELLPLFPVTAPESRGA